MVKGIEFETASEALTTNDLTRIRDDRAPERVQSSSVSALAKGVGENYAEAALKEIVALVSSRPRARRRSWRCGHGRA